MPAPSQPWPRPSHHPSQPMSTSLQPASATPASAATLPPAFVIVEPDTAIGLPHIAIGDHWRPALERFVELVPQMGPMLKLNYARPQPENTPEGADPDDLLLPFVGDPEPCTMHVLPSAVPDAGVVRDLEAFARALHAYDIPGTLGGAIVTQSMIGPVGGYGMKHLFAFLRAVIVEQCGHRLGAHAIETDGTGHDHIFPPHADMWVTSIILNIFNIQPPGQGISTMLRMDDAWATIEASGIPPEGIAQMRRSIADHGSCDLYMQFNAWLYNDHAWSDRLGDELLAMSVGHEMLPGQGYLVDDRRWLHGRKELRWPESYTKEDKLNRLYRLGYNTRESEAFSAERIAAWERTGYLPVDCVGRILDQPANPT